RPPCCGRSTMCCSCFRKPHGTPTSRSTRTANVTAPCWLMDDRYRSYRGSKRRVSSLTAMQTRSAQASTNCAPPGASLIPALLQAPVDLIDRADRTAAGREAATLAGLTRDLASGAVDTLVLIGVNPAYDAPADLEFARHSAKASFRLHLGCYVDETAVLSTWHIPQTHILEAWSDLRSRDGTASLVQPLIRPLFQGWTDHEVLALLTRHADASPYDLVRETWRPKAQGGFEEWWRQALHDGV